MNEAQAAAAHYDLVIVGGGLVGASLGCALAGHALRIAVVEPLATSATDARAGGALDVRSIALAFGTQRIFSALDLWSALAPHAEPITRIEISERGRFAKARLRAQDQQVEALGYVIEHSDLQRVLQQRLAQASNVELFSPAQVTGVQPGADAVQLDLRVGEQALALSAAVVVAADGVHSAVRAALGIPVVQRSYGQTAIVTNVFTQRPHHGVAYERFTDAGPLAFLPLPATDPRRGRCAVVWTVRDAETAGLMALSEGEFLSALQGRFGHFLGRLQEAGTRQAFPLQLVRAREHVRARVALIGNAAHTLHPVAGQGFNLGMRDMAVLAELLADARRQSDDIGATDCLRRYARWRRHDQRSVVTLTDALARLFIPHWAPLRWARGVGLLAMDTVPGLRHFFGRRTMGLAGRLPRLGRGLPLRRDG